MKRLTIEKYKDYTNVTLYTIKLDCRNFNETDDFIFRFTNEQNRQKYLLDFQKILSWINKIGNNGVLERYFRRERYAKAIPIENNKLRFYCVRISDNVLVLGNGGIKTSQSAQDSLDCLPHFELCNEVGKVLKRSIDKQETFVNHKELNGKLDFEIL